MTTHRNDNEGKGSSSLAPIETDTTKPQQPEVVDIEDFHVLHEEAVNNAEGTYIDPATGFMVFTELTHMKRGKCCGNRCRHCPYGFEKVRPPGGVRKGSWRNRKANSNEPPVPIPGAPPAKLRSGDMETAKRMVQEIFDKAGKVNDAGIVKTRIPRKPRASKKSEKENDNEDLSSTSSSSSSSSSTSSYSSSSSSASSSLASTKESNGRNSSSDNNSNTKNNNTPTTITVIEAVKDAAGSSTSEANSSAGTTASATISASSSNKAIPTTTTTTNPTKNVPYTRSGDQGTSQLGTGERRSKTDDAFEAMGTVDELCSFVGVAHAHLLNSHRAKPNPNRKSESSNRKKNYYGALPVRLLDVMSRLFDVGSHVAKPPSTTGDGSTVFVPNGIGDGFDADHVDDLEEWVNEMTEDLPELTSFILPTGAPASAALHVARTVCRRAERRVVPLVVNHKTCDPNALRYLNRLSDFFFVSARWVNYVEGQEEIEYKLDIYDGEDEDDRSDGRSENGSQGGGGGNEEQRGRVVRSLAAPSE